MTFVTLDQYLEQVNRTNQKIQQIQDTLHNNPWLSSNNHLEWLRAIQRDIIRAQDSIQRLDVVRLDTPRLVSMVTQLVTSSQSINQQPASRDTSERVFFSNLNNAVDAATTLLSNVPGGTYDVQYNPLPIEELYGFINALHANTITWMKHLESLTNAAIGRIDTRLSYNRHREDHQLMTTKVDDINESLRQMVTEVSRLAGASANEATMQSLISQLQELSNSIGQTAPNATLQELVRLVQQLQPTNSNSSLMEAHRRLPSYEPQHPSLPCRTHGILKFDDVVTRLPMDVQGRAVSTTLELRSTIGKRPDATEIKFALYDAGVLLVSRHVTTNSRLTSLPGDLLSVVHEHCPRFVYRLTHSGLC
ncbi:40 kDa protein [Arachis pintoi virus]|uniref:40 kDa protein n=1 Tax=Arachis pintoi virus TaxID=1921009 RepID=A0A3G1GJ47_9VIRU|nr:40 kDa protein [Arachis pintoi virus]APG31853.1 40 kDa protein [Arachis pintoi virus]